MMAELRAPGTRPPPTVARAFELARSGDHTNVVSIKRQLKTEQCMDVDAQLSGPSLQAQLRKICGAAVRKWQA
jgi:hypothetical protein